jgi:hypothetical protein
MTARCEFTDLLVDQCAGKCCARPAQVRAVPIERPEPEPPATAPAPKPTWSDLLAAYTPERPGWHTVLSRGQCSGCGSLLGPGAQYTTDETTGRWIAECCVPEEDE